MGEKCCLCFPLDCGVKFLCVVTVLSAIGFGYQSYISEGFRELFLPYFVSSAILGLVWVMAWVSPTESAKNMLFLVFVTCALVFNYGYYAYLIMTGKIEEYNCRPENLAQMNQDISDVEEQTDIDLGGTMTREQCIENSTKWFWGDFATGLLLTIYFTYVIMKWSKHSDGYVKI